MTMHLTSFWQLVVCGRVALRRDWLLPAALSLVAAAGCAAETDISADDSVDVAASALSREREQGAGHSYICKDGVCECDKAVENDCEDMSSECTDDTLNSLIICSEGWLTTHCSCTQRSSRGKGGDTLFPPRPWIGLAAPSTLQLSAN